jgi:hypothetical protein
LPEEFDFKIISLKKRRLEIYVEGCPPWKQAAANGDEKARQKERRALLEEKAREIFGKAPCLVTQIKLSIRYRRNIGRCDATNIIGGIADALQAVYFDDREIRQVHYIEEWGDKDEYWVTVTGKFAEED